ncbi:MAG: MarC family protein [Alphaproteobacteria bacterium]|nr:MarC family protein [Alphaproteobacteria bacterium]MBM4437602.1 MarC family protein [Actinomycetota bacterium]
MTGSLFAALVTFLVVIDPPGMAPVFAALTEHHTPQERRAIALRGTVIAGGVLLSFGLAGEPVLRALGISLPAFRIAGGVLLLLLAIDMVMARQSGLRSTTPPENAETGVREDVSVFPLAIPLIAGPGAMTSMVLHVSAARGDFVLQGAILGLMLLVLASTFACFLIANRIMKLLGVTGVNVVSRVMGILLAAMSIQFMVDGIVQAWPGLAT